MQSFILDRIKKRNVIQLSQFEVESGRNKLPPKRSNQLLEDQKKVNLKAIKYISLKSKLHFYKLRQPQQIAVVILINQLASVDQAIQDFKGVALNSGLFPFRKLSSLFCIHRFPIIHYFYLFISIWGPSEYAALLPRHILERRA